MADITNQTQETAPSLESFNESEPKAAEATPTPAATEPKPAEAQPAEPAKAAEPAKTAEPAKPADATPAQAEDVYAKVTEGLMVPKGLEVEDSKLGSLKDLAKQYNIPADAVKALLQLDLNNSAADILAEKKMLEKAHQEWEQANKAKYGDNLKNVETDCSRVLAELDKDGKFKELLALVGVERHPATLGFLKSIGDIHLEKPSVSPNATVSASKEVELEDFN